MHLTVDPQDQEPPFRKPWKNAVAVGRAYELLREDTLTHLRFLQQSIGYRYCRFHGLFHDEMGVVRSGPGNSLIFQWHQLDKIYDSLLDMGLRPFVELNPMPSALASGTQTIFDWKMNVTPPCDYGRWQQLVEAFARHCVDRYGLEEVRQWYFEVWNEPNLEGFWSGTKEDYWKLYDASARGLKNVSPEFRIGGPASSKATWIQDMIDHCTLHQVPLDFVSTHLYPQDEYVNYPHRKGSPHKPGEFFIDTVRDVQRQVAKSTRPDLEIHWTEWNSLSASTTGEVSWSRNDSVDSLQGAAVVCHNCIALDSACDTLCWWVATDIFEEVGLPQSEFSCTYGLVTLSGLPKATFHAFDFLKRLGPRRIAVRHDGPLPPGCACCAGATSETLQLLIWHKIVPEKEAQETWKTRVTMPIAEKGDYVLIESRIAAGQGSAWETWIKLGRPQNPSVEEMRLLRNHAQPKCDFSAFPKAEDAISFDLLLAPGEVCFLELRRQGPSAAPKVASRQELAEWEQKMSAASKV